jgi:hypothetical protein
MEAESDEYPWPKPGDILFRSDNDPQSDAWINWALTGWDAYASGYLEAANLLVEKVLETGQRTDTLVYPVARFRRGRRKEHSRARFNPDLPTVAFKPARKNCSDIALGVVYQDEFEEGNLTR